VEHAATVMQCWKKDDMIEHEKNAKIKVWLRKAAAQRPKGL
jgi:hypothetical protein